MDKRTTGDQEKILVSESETKQNSLCCDRHMVSLIDSETKYLEPGLDSVGYLILRDMQEIRMDHEVFYTLQVNRNNKVQDVVLPKGHFTYRGCYKHSLFNHDLTSAFIYHGYANEIYFSLFNFDTAWIRSDAKIPTGVLIGSTIKNESIIVSANEIYSVATPSGKTRLIFTCPFERIVNAHLSKDLKYVLSISFTENSHTHKIEQFYYHVTNLENGQTNTFTRGEQHVDSNSLIFESNLNFTLMEEDADPVVRFPLWSTSTYSVDIKFS